mmetsp:Transcript_116295/g.200894  ORF Transcript_116295/g.200894 Transcript_116295/m.200894 type:complete len:464 (-) Transcript_116295:88-1479(-)
MTVLGEWRYDDCTEVTAVMTMTWSKKLAIDECIKDLKDKTSQDGKSERAILVKVPAGISGRAVQCANAQAAIDHLKASEAARKDEKESQGMLEASTQPEQLVSNSDSWARPRSTADSTDAAKQSQHETHHPREKRQRQRRRRNQRNSKECTMSPAVVQHGVGHASPDEKLKCGRGEQKAPAAVTGNTTQPSCLQSDSFSDDENVRRGITFPDDLEIQDQTAEHLATDCNNLLASSFDSGSYDEEEDVRRGIEFTFPEPEKVRRNVAIFADYDGCFDIISETNLPGAKMDKMFDYAKEIDRLLYPRSHAEKMLTKFLDQITADATRVTLFSGSNRQSRKLDESNAVQNDNGLARTGLKKLAEERKWHYESNLLEDAGQNPSSIMSTAGGSSEIKKLLVENNFKFLTGPTQVYFFDDVEKYLKYARVNATIPENIELKTVQFDWYGICIDGTQAGDHPLVPISCK